MEFTLARAIVRAENLSGRYGVHGWEGWSARVRAHAYPAIPGNPWRPWPAGYGGRGWLGWQDWLTEPAEGGAEVGTGKCLPPRPFFIKLSV